MSITSDNGSNMLKLVDILNNEAEIDFLCQDGVIVAPTEESPQECEAPANHFAEPLYNDNLPDQRISEVIELYESSDAELELDQLISVDGPTNNFYDDVINSSVFTNGIMNLLLLIVFGIKCAAHTLQLAVRAALREANTVVTIKLCRTVAMALATQVHRYELMTAGIKCGIPHMDCLTRWSSTCLMVNLLYD